jgi:hypothetical protein
MKTLKVYANATDSIVLYRYTFNRERSPIYVDYDIMIRTAKMLHGTFRIQNIYECTETQFFSLPEKARRDIEEYSTRRKNTYERLYYFTQGKRGQSRNKV